MSLKVEKFDIEGPLLIHVERHLDDRGYFSEIYNEQLFTELGLPHFVQDNLSRSKKGVFRGLHWQLPPMEQGKLVSCLHGEILDLAVDIRRSSPTFGRHLSVVLSSEMGLALWVPPGFAHGFESKVDGTLVSYKVTNKWSPVHEQSLNPFDPLLGLNLKVGQNILSSKDLTAPGLDGHSGLFEK